MVPNALLFHQSLLADSDDAGIKPDNGNTQFNCNEENEALCNTTGLMGQSEQVVNQTKQPQNDGAWMQLPPAADADFKDRI
jgi:hypothetical protein